MAKTTNNRSGTAREHSADVFWSTGVVGGVYPHLFLNSALQQVCRLVGRTHTAHKARVTELCTRRREGRAARSRQGSVEWASEQRAHSVGSAAAAALVAPLV